MNALTATIDFHNALELLRRPVERCAELELVLVEAIKEGLDFFSDNCSDRTKINLYPSEVTAVQHFLTQFGFHLERIRKSSDKIATTQTYKVVPNWK